MRTFHRYLLPLAQGLGAFVVEIAAIIVLYRRNSVLLVVLCVETAIVLRIWRERFDRAFFLVIALIGSLAELAFVRAGIWHYANPSFAQLPVWFPVSFGLAGLIVLRLARALVALWDQLRPPRNDQKALE